MSSDIPWYIQNKESIGTCFKEFHDSLYEDGALSDKTRELLMLSLACAFRCPHCTEEHIEKALEVGASREEVSEALLLTAVEGAGTQLYWAKDIYEKHLGDSVETP